MVKRRGAGVVKGEGRPLEGAMSVEVEAWLAGVVNMSSSWVADVVAVDGRADGEPVAISSWLRFPGVVKRAVRGVLRGVSGGSMALRSLPMRSAAWASSSSSLRGQS